MRQRVAARRAGVRFEADGGIEGAQGLAADAERRLAVGTDNFAGNDLFASVFEVFVFGAGEQTQD